MSIFFKVLHLQTYRFKPLIGLNDGRTEKHFYVVPESKMVKIWPDYKCKNILGKKLTES